MVRIILVQNFAALVASGVAFIFLGVPGALSALLGGLGCSLPNAFFAFKLYMNTKNPSGPSPSAFFVWEFVKIALTIVFLGSAAYLYKDLHWLAFMAGIIVVLKSYIFLLFRS